METPANHNKHKKRNILIIGLVAALVIAAIIVGLMISNRDEGLVSDSPYSDLSEVRRGADSEHLIEYIHIEQVEIDTSDWDAITTEEYISNGVRPEEAVWSYQLSVSLPFASEAQLSTRYACADGTYTAYTRGIYSCLKRLRNQEEQEELDRICSAVEIYDPVLAAQNIKPTNGGQEGSTPGCIPVCFWKAVTPTDRVTNSFELIFNRNNTTTVATVLGNNSMHLFETKNSIFGGVKEKALLAADIEEVRISPNQNRCFAYDSNGKVVEGNAIVIETTIASN